MGTPNWHACWCSPKLKKKLLSWWRDHSDGTAILLKNYVIFDDVTDDSNFVHKFVFWYWVMKCISQVNYVTKRLVTLVLSIGWKMLRWLQKTLKIGKLSVASATSKFQKLFVMNLDSNSSRFEIEIFLLKGFITKNWSWGKKCPPNCVK